MPGLKAGCDSTVESTGGLSVVIGKHWVKDGVWLSIESGRTGKRMRSLPFLHTLIGKRPPIECPMLPARLDATPEPALMR